MIEQPQSDTKLQPNQLELTIHDKTPHIVDLVYYYPAYLH